ncbi:hypothetical protein D3C83_68540 [compost metagenome]
MIDIVFIRAVIIDGPILTHIIIHHFLDIVEPFHITCIIPDAFNPFQYHTLVVAPAGLSAGYNRK